MHHLCHNAFRIHATTRMHSKQGFWYRLWVHSVCMLTSSWVQTGMDSFQYVLTWIPCKMIMWGCTMIMWVKQPNPVKGAPHFFTKSSDFSIFVGSKSDNKVSLHHTVFLLIFTTFFLGFRRITGAPAQRCALFEKESASNQLQPPTELFLMDL